MDYALPVDARLILKNIGNNCKVKVTFSAAVITGMTAMFVAVITNLQENRGKSRFDFVFYFICHLFHVTLHSLK